MTQLEKCKELETLIIARMKSEDLIIFMLKHWNRCSKIELFEKIDFSYNLGICKYLELHERNTSEYYKSLANTLEGRLEQKTHDYEVLEEKYEELKLLLEELQAKIEANQKEKIKKLYTGI